MRTQLPPADSHSQVRCVFCIFLPAVFCCFWFLFLFASQSSDSGLLVIILVMATLAVCIMFMSYLSDVCAFCPVLNICSGELLLLAASLYAAWIHLERAEHHQSNATELPCVAINGPVSSDTFLWL